MKEKITKILKTIKSNPIYIYIFVYSIFLIVLSLFRHASADETYYLRETMLISELLKNGEWVGNYGVGLHGFLFKLPVALAFIILGKPSVFVATLFTIILSISSLFLFYYLIKKFFKKGNYALYATILLSVSFHFLSTSLTFLRDIPAVFSVLLFLFLFLNKSNSWKLGLSLLLLLDAKEHVFLTVAPVFGIYTVINQLYFINISSKWGKIKNIIIELFKGYFFSVLWILLMFTTSLIPMNMFIASIAGQIDTGTTWNTSHFRSSVATENLMSGEDKVIPKIFSSSKIVEIGEGEDKIVVDKGFCDDKKPIICFIANSVNTITGYVGKILYPRTFSFISIPKIIVLPSIVIAISMLIKWFKNKDRKVVLPIALLLNILVLIFRASHGRYLLCVAPVFFIFFIIFLKDAIKKPRYFRNILIFTTIFVLLGLFFESNFLIYKIILEILLLILFWGIWLFRKNEKFLNFFKALFFLNLIVGMFLTSLAYSYKIGQLSSYIRYGYNRETSSIVNNIDEKETIWINDYGSGELINFGRKNLSLEPEWIWQLKSSIPKKSIFKTYSLPNTYSSDIVDMQDFRNYLEENKIEKVVMLVSLIEEESFVNQGKIKELLSQDWLLCMDKIQLKNKEMYIFNLDTSVNGKIEGECK